MSASIWVAEKHRKLGVVTILTRQDPLHETRQLNSYTVEDPYGARCELSTGTVCELYAGCRDEEDVRGGGDQAKAVETPAKPRP